MHEKGHLHRDISGKMNRFDALAGIEVIRLKLRVMKNIRGEIEAAGIKDQSRFWASNSITGKGPFSLDEYTLTRI